MITKQGEEERIYIRVDNMARAIQWTGTNYERVCVMLGRPYTGPNRIPWDRKYEQLKVRDDREPVSIGEWIVLDKDGIHIFPNKSFQQRFKLEERHV